MTGPPVVLAMARVEARELRGLVDQFLDLLRDTGVGEDPAVDRLVPSPYPDDAEAATMFADATADDLLDRRSADARIVHDALTPPEDAEDEDDLAEIRIPVPAPDLDAWLRTLTALRLVIASRLGIEQGVPPDPDDPRYGVYDWLGFRLDGLIEAAEA